MSAGLVLAMSGGALIGLLARRLGIPGGAILGSLVGAAAIQLATGAETEIPTAVRLLAQGAIGAVIGARFEVEILAAVRRLLAYAVPLLAVMMGSAVALGLLFAQLAQLELPIGVLSTIPGGSGDVIAVALDLGEDAAFIATVHLSRQILVFVSLGLVASLTMRVYRRRRASSGRPVIVWCAGDDRSLVLAYASAEEAGWSLPRVASHLVEADDVRQVVSAETGLDLAEGEVAWHDLDVETSALAGSSTDDPGSARGTTRGDVEPSRCLSVGIGRTDDLGGDGVWLEVDTFRERTAAPDDLAALDAWTGRRG